MLAHYVLDERPGIHDLDQMSMKIWEVLLEEHLNKYKAWESYAGNTERYTIQI